MFVPSLNPASVPLALTAVGMLVLGLAVLVREQGSRESRAFFTLSLTVVVWLVGFAGMYSAPDPATAMLWAKGAYVGIPLIPPAILAFTRSVLRIHRRRASILVGAWALGLGFVVAFLRDLELVGVYRYSWGYYPRFGLAGIPYLAFFGGTLLVAMWEFWTEYRDARPGAHRVRVRALMVGFAVAYVAVLDYLPAFGVEMYPFGFALVLVFLGISGWTIGRYRLVDLTPSFAAGQILATMADPLIVVDPEGRIRILNASACAALGVTPEELLEQPIEVLAVPGSPDAEILRSICGGPVLRDQEMLLVDCSGAPIEVSVSASPLLDAVGEPAGTVLIARDVRERKEAERTLRESEERFRSLIENITDAIVLLGLDGTVRYASSSLERVIGWAPGERLGRSVAELLHPEDVESAMRTLKEGAAIPGYTVSGEYRVRHRDGSWRNVEVTATNLAHLPAVGGIIVTYHDVTERRAAEVALRESEDKLRQSQRLEAVGRLAGGVAHDFNNLLTVINGQTGLVAGGHLDPDEAREALDEVMGAGERAASLTRQLLAFSRKQVLQPKVLDVNAAAADMKKILARLIGEDVELATDLDPDLYPVLADPGQVEQVLLNLAVNARDAMPRGGRLTIATHNAVFTEASPAGEAERAPGSYACLVVRDTGVGIPEAIQSHIFEPFFTTKEQGEGTGLGLATVYGIVKQSGGWIEVESAADVGSTFRVFLPRVAGETTPARERGEGDRRDREPSGVGRTILLAEDDASVRRLVRRILEREGFSVLEARGGAEALALAEGSAPPDLLLTDVVMPEMSGRELADRLRRRFPGLPVLYISGYTDDALGNHGVLDPGIHLLPKPFGPADLKKAVLGVLAAAR